MDSPLLLVGTHIAICIPHCDIVKKAAKMGETGNIFMQFLASRKHDLQRIARATRNEFSEKDLCGVAWEMFIKIGNKQGTSIDLANRDDQELLLRWIYSEVVHYKEKLFRNAVRLDKDWDSDDAESADNRLAKLEGPQESFDLTGLMDSEEKQAAVLDIVRRSYSQYSAYVILLNRFEWDVIVLSEYLRSLTDTLVRRFRASERHMETQPSLFDRIQKIEHDFAPMLSRIVIRKPVQEVCSLQLEWDFG